MNTPFPFSVVLMFSFLSTMLIVGFLIRANLKIVQKYLFPSSLLGGLIGLAIVNFKPFHLDPKIFEAFTFHFFNISFISIGLTPTSTEEKLSKKESSDSFKGSLWMALIEGVVFPAQALVGGILVILFVSLGMRLHSAFGFLLPLAFEEGPGQALSFGRVWETMGFQNAATIGITYAILGFMFAIFVGVPLVNWGIRKGLAKEGKGKLPEEFLKGFYAPERREEVPLRLTTHPANIESLAFQLALVGLVYGLTYLVVKYLAQLMGGSNGNLAWGFFFLFGMVIAMGVRYIMGLLKIEYLISVPLQRRITGFSVDYLIVATGCAIQLEIISKAIIPILVISIAGGLLTLWIVMFLGRRLHSYNLERISAIYGTVTGTVSTGLLLLRIVDPEFKTPVPKEIGFMNIFAVPIIFILTYVVNKGPFWWHLGTLPMVGVFAGFTILFVFLIKVFGLIGERRF